MSARRLAYRLFRLRRLIALAVAAPTVLLLFFAAFAGPAPLYALPLVAGLPVLHALRFPHAWTETLGLSATLTALAYVMAVAAIFAGPAVLAVVFVVALMLACVGFVWLQDQVPTWLAMGPEVPVVARARRLSRQPVARLEDAMAIAPARRSATYAAGPEEADGAFPVTIATPRGLLALDGAAFRARVVPPTQQLHEAGGRAGSGDGTWHEVRCVDRQGLDLAALRLRLDRSVIGTWVTAVEVARPATRPAAFGIWLRDGLADRLTAALDAVAQRSPRALVETAPDTLLDAVIRRVDRWRRRDRDRAAEGAAPGAARPAPETAATDDVIAAVERQLRYPETPAPRAT